MNRKLQTLIATAALLGPAFAHPAFAENSYPRVVGSGENIEIDYGPGLRGNIVGGGVAEVLGSGENQDIRYSGEVRAQSSRDGLVAHIIGSGENASVVYVPAEIDRTRRAMIGGDGSLPVDASQGNNRIARMFGRPLNRG
jgi:hypothetical protein